MQSVLTLVPVAAIIGVALVILVIALMARSAHARAKSVQYEQAAAALGLRYEPTGDAGFRAAWSALPELPAKGKIEHVVFGEHRGVAVTAFRHHHVVSTGQSAAVIVHWVFSTETPEWPAVHLRRRSALGLLFGHRSRVTSDAVFDRAWVIKADSPAFAAEILTEPVRRMLMAPVPQKSRGTKCSWRIRDARLCLLVRGAVRPEQLAPHLDRVVEVWAAMAPG